MLQFAIGFALGIYIATQYDCRPIINKCNQTIEAYLPKKVTSD